ncbi:MAG: CRISPR-associated endonuclease Cas2 [Cyanobacteriota bacterium]|nr:CRISPR-associated endonuclease Cas2 [Cyanobacteriota bacterium]
MDVLITYDVNTETSAGRKRLRKVAIACKDYGQRVQFSVFECRVDQAHYEKLRAKLTKIIDPSVDSLRFYRLPSPRENHLECFGVDKYIDFEEPLVL